MDREIVYDRRNDRIVFLAIAPDQDYWEGLWESRATSGAIRRGDRFVTLETQRVLPPGARILDAGCGIGATVYGLAQAGFDAYGIDYAQKTVAKIKSLEPQLQVQVGDVRALPFEDGKLDGIWSLGVVEHFYEGYDALIAEMHRALRPGGYLFLTVPVISLLRALKIRLGAIPHYDEALQREKFFQFSFHSAHVAARVSQHGFGLIRGYGRSGSLGLTEDLPGLGRLLALHRDASSLGARARWRLIDKLVTPFSQHTRFFLFQKT